MGGSHAVARKLCLKNGFLPSNYQLALATSIYWDEFVAVLLAAERRGKQGVMNNHVQPQHLECPVAKAVPSVTVKTSAFRDALRNMIDAARESARYQFEENQAAQRRAHLLILAHLLGRRS